MHKEDLEDNYSYIEEQHEKEKLTQELVEKYVGYKLDVGDNKLLVKLTPHGFYQLRYLKGQPIPKDFEGSFSSIASLAAAIRSFFNSKDSKEAKVQFKIDADKAREQRQRKVEQYAKRESTKSGVELREGVTDGSKQA